MPINFEIKGQLAKLLATEDLVIENKNVETAMFNIETRVLTLPMWEKATNEVYDMLVGHEVGHALYTPNDWSFEGKIPRQFVNVVEDARIEKLMKRKYAGLFKTFVRGYKELSDQDFFQLEGSDIKKMNLADRVNLHFKIGSFVDIPFNDFDEMPIVRMIGECETFSDVLIAAEVLYKYCKKKQQEKTKTDKHQNQQPNSNNSGGEDFDDQVPQEQQENVNEEDGVNEDTSFENDNFELESDHNEELAVETDNNLSSKLKDLIDSDRLSNEYIEIPDLDLKTIVNSNKEVHDVIVDYFKAFEFWQEVFLNSDAKFEQFKKDAQKEVNYLVKEFECKKAASNYARASVSRTGILDCAKLHTYKYNEDLFKKVTTIADGKNHGLIFILDWSGSMCNTILDTIKQLYNLIWFCKKVNIPFDVYAFTNDFRKPDKLGDITYVDPMEHYIKKEGLFCVDKTFSLMNLFTSDISTKDLNVQMRNIWRCVYSIRHYCEYDIPSKLSLSGTPLNESIISLHKIIPNFKKKYGLEKVNCIILTDGEANHLARHKVVTRYWEKQSKYIGAVGLTPNRDYLRNRNTGKTYSIPYEYNKFTNILLNDLKSEFPNVNFIGIRILEPRESGNFIRSYCPDFVEKIQQWRKNKMVSIENMGYEKYFGIASTSLSQDTEFSVKEDATKSQIKSAFVKSLSSKKMNKKLLSEFIELVV